MIVYHREKRLEHRLLCCNLLLRAVCSFVICPQISTRFGGRFVHKQRNKWCYFLTFQNRSFKKNNNTHLLCFHEFLHSPNSEVQKKVVSDFWTLMCVYFNTKLIHIKNIPNTILCYLHTQIVMCSLSALTVSGCSLSCFLPQKSQKANSHSFPWITESASCTLGTEVTCVHEIKTIKLWTIKVNWLYTFTCVLLIIINACYPFLSISTLKIDYIHWDIYVHFMVPQPVSSFRNNFTSNSQLYFILFWSSHCLISFF